MKDIMQELRERERQLLIITSGLEDLCRRHEARGDKLRFASALRAIMRHAQQAGDEMEKTQEVHVPELSGAWSTF